MFGTPYILATYLRHRRSHPFAMAVIVSLIFDSIMGTSNYRLRSSVFFARVWFEFCSLGVLRHRFRRFVFRIWGNVGDDFIWLLSPWKVALQWGFGSVGIFFAGGPSGHVWELRDLSGPMFGSFRTGWGLVEMFM